MDARPPLTPLLIMLPMSSASFLQRGSHHRVDVSLWTAESSTYDPEILKQISFEFRRVELVLCMQSIGSQRGGSMSIWLRSGRSCLVLGCKEVYRVWAVPLVDKIEDLRGEPDVGVILLPSR